MKPRDVRIASALVHVKKLTLFIVQQGNWLLSVVQHVVKSCESELVTHTLITLLHIMYLIAILGVKAIPNYVC